MTYKDRFDAGKKVAASLAALDGDEVVVLAIPNGGIPVGIGIANELHARLGVLLIRRIQYPFTTESGFGAVDVNGTTYINETLARQANLGQQEIDRQVAKAMHEAKEKARRCGFDRFSPDVRGKTVVLTDDGIAAGSTMTLAAKLVRARDPGRLVIAVPTAPASSVARLRPVADEITCPDVRHGLRFAVANAYETWRDLSDAEVTAMLEEHARRAGTWQPANHHPSR